MNEIRCPYCEGSNIKKHGILPSGNQKYYCKDCDKSFSKNTVIRLTKSTIEDKCPYCGGELTTKGWNKSGTRRYKCKVCGKGCSEHTVKLPKKDAKECPHCHSKFTRKQGKLKSGKTRYYCKTCKTYFSDGTVIKEPINVKCDSCNSSNIIRSGRDTKTGKQRYKCNECGKKFVEIKIQKTFIPQEKTCPICGHKYAKKGGMSGDKKQYYICLDCGHKYLENGVYKHITTLQKSTIIKEIIKGKSVKNVSDVIGCSERTIRNIMGEYYKKETLTEEQKQLIIKFGVYLAVPPEYLAPYVPCTLHKCKEILSQYVIKQPKPYVVSPEERAREKVYMDRFLA